jgi:hypothetical protein
MREIVEVEVTEAYKHLHRRSVQGPAAEEGWLCQSLLLSTGYGSNCSFLIPDFDSRCSFPFPKRSKSRGAQI